MKILGKLHESFEKTLIKFQKSSIKISGKFRKKYMLENFIKYMLENSIKDLGKFRHCFIKIALKFQKNSFIRKYH